jgi:hypothetical protein
MRQILIAVCLVALVPAQSVIVPSEVATRRPTRRPFWNPDVFYSQAGGVSDSRSQSIVDVNDIPVATATWSSVAVAMAIIGHMNPAFTANATITMSVSSQAWDAASTVFAANHGTNVVQVFSGQLSLPTRLIPPLPEFWEAPFPFTVPFHYARTMGRSLVIDVLQTGNTGGSPWLVEVTTPDVGSRASNGDVNRQTSCFFSNGSRNYGVGYNALVPGGSWTVAWVGVLPNALGMVAIGGQGAGGQWNGLQLPIDLAAVGAPGCGWWVSADFLTAAMADATGIARLTVPVPDLSSLRGATFYDQAAFVDPAANALGLVTTWSGRWTIGTGIGAPGSFLSATDIAAHGASGRLRVGTLPSLKLSP